MILDFDKIEEQVIPNFKGGEKEIKSHMYMDGACKIMRASLEPDASIGLHTHETSSEIIFMIEGTGVVVCDGKREVLSSGECHYCPKGHSHSLRNESDDEIVFYAVVPEQ